MLPPLHRLNLQLHTTTTTKNPCTITAPMQVAKRILENAKFDTMSDPSAILGKQATTKRKGKENDSSKQDLPNR
ncbi:hypothetical protein UFOVP204_156 [uncultured Caudovirales phage]|uniref:Uncharacterized protein n=1 Tax=uncultured Caudovirales phage TaxID=2100421 RepID=A0A6J7WQ70_9CAUD|nr:hypothetical protein UFOVP204_156 [uncultured Caudovirales phage]